MSKVIYSSEDKISSRQISLVHHWFEEKVRQIFRIFGAGILAFAVVLFMFSYGQIITQEINYRLKSPKVEQTTSQIDQPVSAENINEVESEARKYNVTAYFSIIIFKIDAAANIIPNVDFTSPDSYLPALQKGVAHALGSGFPGQDARIFLFSHSTDSPANFARYNAIFYLLRKLDKGDRITIFFAAKKYVYEVTDKFIVSPSESSWIEPKYGEEQLVLMTCDPPGTIWNRLLVIAKPVGIVQ